jgi:hypothetical protein
MHFLQCPLPSRTDLHLDGKQGRKVAIGRFRRDAIKSGLCHPSVNRDQKSQAQPHNRCWTETTFDESVTLVAAWEQGLSDIAQTGFFLSKGHASACSPPRPGTCVKRRVCLRLEKCGLNTKAVEPASNS